MGRYYDIDGLLYPSVTTILEILDKSNALINWALNCYEEKAIELFADIPRPYADDDIITLLSDAKKQYKTVSRKALDIGSEVHNAIEKWLNNKPYELTTVEANNGFNAFLEWAVENDFCVVETEKQVSFKCDNYWYAGTLDCIGYLDKKRYIVDFKTSKAFYEPVMPLQLAAYLKADKTEYINNMGVLRLDKVSGKPEFKDYSDKIDKYVSSFEHLAALYFGEYAAKKVLKSA